MDENKIINAFQKIKQDISELKTQINEIKHQITIIRNQTIPTDTPTQLTIPTDTPTHIPTNQQSIEPLSIGNERVSIGNEGVPTDKPTDRQTNQQTDNYPEKFAQSIEKDPLSEFEKANKILESLDNIKKEIRLKFKRLTPQEMLIFTTLYNLQEQNLEEITYKLLANNLNLSESSIRDYTNKLLKKGIPVLKVRQNNKKITLEVSPDLRKIASLSTIIQLRDL